MAIYKTAHFKVRPEGLEKCQHAIREFIAYIKENEPGTHLYTALNETEDATSFLHYFIFEDEAAEETHRTSEAVRHFTSILYPETVDGVVFTDYVVLASTEG